MPTLTQGSIDLQVGALHAVSLTGDCRTSANQPSELTALTRYHNAQVIDLDHPGPCEWVVTLLPQAVRDVTYDPAIKPPVPRDYNSVSIALSHWESFAVHTIHQDGLIATVEATAHYRFTPTMRQLDRAGVHPELPSGCSYHSLQARIDCARQFPLTFADGVWRLDPAQLT